MQNPEDSITVVEPRVEAYAETNLDDKTLGTQYIYTTEGQLIPANEHQNTTSIDLTSQHYSTVHVTEAQNIHIQQVDYQYEQQYADGTVEQVVSVTESDLVSNSDTTYVVEQAPYVPAANQGELIQQQPYATEEVVKNDDFNNERSAITSTEDDSTPEQNASSSESPLATDLTKSKSNEGDTFSDQIDVDSQTSKPLSNSDDHSETLEVLDEQSDLQGLESNPAIEIENDDSVEEIQQSVAADGAEDNVIAVESMEDSSSKKDSADGSNDVDVSTSTEERSPVHNVAVEVEVKNPKPRGRKPKTDIPLHILGHNVEKPIENFVNGKTPKPRLGVKVPYRNLTSQIVSKADIEKEVLERGVKKIQERKDKAFARKLTSRLAKKISPDEDPTAEKLLNASETEDDEEAKTDKQDGLCDTNGNEASPQPKLSNAIDNDSDLLAILEGDGDTEMVEMATEPQNKESSPTDETNLKNLEREIALQQLQDLPYLEPKTKYVKSNKFKPVLKEPVSSSSEDNVSSSSDRTSVTKNAPFRSSVKINSSKFEEPQIKIQHLTLKTYSRKRKSSDATMPESTPSPSKKTTNVVPAEPKAAKPVTESPATPVYMTKSSRVIKKKVIWDPDESSPKLKSTVNKTEVSPQIKTLSKNETKPADLTKKSAADLKQKPDKKADDKPTPKRISHISNKTTPATKPVLKPKKHNKPRSEVDRLLGDEGAIKMLYDLKNSENAIDEKRKKTVISVEKTFKELAKKANLIKSDLVSTSTAETPKFLRKKEPTISPSPSSVKLTATAVSTTPSAISRQKSKDSARSTPPPSPGFSYSNEVSYLIRRRSSSSISDGNGESFEFDDTEVRPTKKPSASIQADQPKSKKPKKHSTEKEKALKKVENCSGHFNTFTYKKVNKTVTIDLHTNSSTKCHFTSEVLSELTTVVNNLSKEKDCSVVLIRSSNEHAFSYGVDYKELVSDKDSTRKSKARDLAKLVKEFIQSLLDFPKVLVAGIQGECNGLAVTMLPLFDIVIASDDATFSTSYATLGCAPEAGFLLTVPHVGNFGLAGELLFASQKLTADEAQRRGLISKLCWPEKYQETVKATVAAVAQGSTQSLESTKKHLRSYLVQSTEKALDSMVCQLIDHWTSSECQNNFANIQK